MKSDVFSSVELSHIERVVDLPQRQPNCSVGNSGPRLGTTRGNGEQDIVDVHNAVLYLVKAGASEVSGLAPIPIDMRSLIEAGEFKTALSFLWLIEKRENPKVLNYIGFTTRKLGNVDDGIKYYHRAIALDPNYVRAREYLGEGYLQKGELGAARVQLAEIEQRCGRDCVEYQALATAITDYKAGNFSAKRSW